jgi:hypothetical protein
MSFQIGDKVWVKPLGAIAAAAEKRKRPGDEDRLLFSDCGYDFVPQMRKYCERQVEITDYCGGSCFLIKEDNGEWVWHESWLSKDLQAMYVTDFEGAFEKKATPAEIYWEQIMPQLKEIVINAYNKGVENGKNECV